MIRLVPITTTETFMPIRPFLTGLSTIPVLGRAPQARAKKNF
jgi:hypothetical protein